MLILSLSSQAGETILVISPENSQHADYQHANIINIEMAWAQPHGVGILSGD